MYMDDAMFYYDTQQLLCRCCWGQRPKADEMGTVASRTAGASRKATVAPPQ
jgi:hypothetical protein